MPIYEFEDECGIRFTRRMSLHEYEALRVRALNYDTGVFSLNGETFTQVFTPFNFVIKSGSLKAGKVQ